MQGNRNPFGSQLPYDESTLEIPQRIPMRFGTEQARIAGTIPTAEQESLQAPRIDPIMTAANVVSGEPFGVIKPTSFGSVLNKVLGDLFVQHAMSSIVGGRGGSLPFSEKFPAPPAGYQEGYYPRSEHVAPRTIIPFRETEALRDTSGRSKSSPEFKYGPGFKKTSDLDVEDYSKPPWSPKSYKEDLPDYVTQADTISQREFMQNLKPYGEEGPPNPRELLWHAIGLGEDSFYGSVGRDIQRKGMERGWFSEQPHGNFAPIRIGAKPEDLPSMMPRLRTLHVDPITELIPGWTPRKWQSAAESPTGYGRTGISKNYMTRSGYEAPISIHPSKFTVIDSEGNLLGRLADTRAGAKATQPLAQSFREMLEQALEDVPK